MTTSIAKPNAAQLMPKAEAQQLLEAIRADVTNLAEKLREFRDRFAWASLGYDSWANCVKEEFGYSKQHANRLIAAQQIKRRVEPIGSTYAPRKQGGEGGTKVPPTPPESRELPESHARELARLPEDQQADCYVDYIEECGETIRPTAAGLRDKVETWLADNEPPETEEREVDDDGDCANCHEPGDEPEESGGEATEDEAPDKTWNDTIAAWSKALRQVGKAVKAHQNPWAEECCGIFTAELKTAIGCLTAVKAAGPCPYCDGEGCKTCLGTGYLPKQQLDSAPPK